jgi:putative mRNA 3-end processing factor
VDSSIGEIFIHGSIKNVNEALSQSGLKLPNTTYVTADIAKERFKKSLIIAPPSAMGTSWVRRFGEYEVATASGWMNIRGIKRRRNAGKGFVISDHADWDELNHAVRESGASKVYVTHGYKDVFSRWLNQSGIKSHVMDTLYEGEVDDN